MHLITERNVTTPWSAHYAAVSNETNGVLTVEYYGRDKHLLSDVPYASRVMRQEAYKSLVKEPSGGKPAVDKRRSDQDKRKDLPKGKNTTGIEDELLDLPVDDPHKDFWDDAQEVGVKKQAKQPVGKSQGGKVEKIKEGLGNENTYTWMTILQALNEVGVDEEQVKQLVTALSGNEFSNSIGESAFDRLYALNEEPVVYDAEGAQDEFAATQEEPAEKKNSIAVGMTTDELYSSLLNVSKRYASNLEGIPRGTTLKIIGLTNGAVYKIVPATVLSIKKGNLNHEFTIKIMNQTKTLTISNESTKEELKQTKNGNFVYIDKSKDTALESDIDVKFRGQ